MQKSTFVFLAVLLAVANVSAFKIRQSAQLNCSRVHDDLRTLDQFQSALTEQLNIVAPQRNSQNQQQQQSRLNLVAVKDLLTQEQGEACDYYFQYNLGFVFDNTCKRYLSLEKEYQADPVKYVAQACASVSFNEPLLQNRQVAASGEQKDIACMFSQILEQLHIFATTIGDFAKSRCPAQNFLVSQQPQLNCTRAREELQIIEEVVHNLQGFLNQAAPVQSQARQLVQSRKLRKNFRVNQFIKQQIETCDYYYQFKLGTVYDETCARYKQLEQRLQSNAAEVLANACNQVTFNEPQLQGRQLPQDGETRNAVCFVANAIDLYKVFLDSVKALQAKRCLQY